MELAGSYPVTGFGVSGVEPACSAVAMLVIYYEDIWGSGCIDQRILDLGSSWR
jgi:hypothetical protein